MNEEPEDDFPLAALENMFPYSPADSMRDNWKKRIDFDESRTELIKSESRQDQCRAALLSAVADCNLNSLNILAKLAQVRETKAGSPYALGIAGAVSEAITLLRRNAVVAEIAAMEYLAELGDPNDEEMTIEKLHEHRKEKVDRYRAAIKKEAQAEQAKFPKVMGKKKEAHKAQKSLNDILRAAGIEPDDLPDDDEGGKYEKHDPPINL